MAEPLNKHARGEGRKKKIVFLNRGIKFVQFSPEAKKRIFTFEITAFITVGWSKILPLTQYNFSQVLWPVKRKDNDFSLEKKAHI